ncbi:MAG: GTP-binding protein, partial [Actinoplanes sp.]
MANDETRAPRVGADLIIHSSQLGGVIGQVALPPGPWRRPRWSADGTRLAVVTSTDILVVDIAAGRILSRVSAFQETIEDIAISADGRYVAALGDTVHQPGADILDAVVGERSAPGRTTPRTAHVDQTTTDLKIFDCINGRIVASVHTVYAGALSFAPVGHLLVTGHIDCPRIWEPSPDGLALVSELRQQKYMFTTLVAFDRTADLLLADSGQSFTVMNVQTGQLQGEFEYRHPVSTAVFSPDSRLVASGGANRSIELWDWRAGVLSTTLEGHTDEISRLSFFADGRHLASETENGEVRIWDTKTFEVLATARSEQTSFATAAADERLALLETAPAGGQLLTLLRLELRRSPQSTESRSVKYTTAKIVLLGDSGVGKTALGWRLAHGVFQEQHTSTHGQQFWPLEQLGVVRADGTECEAILWDLAGQSDYRLIHALFLDDADLALVLFDPTVDIPLQSATYWMRQLGVASPDGRSEAILVAGRSDRGYPRMSEAEVEQVRAEVSARKVIATSALTGEGLQDLIEEVRRAIDWDRRPTTITTETFKRIKDHVLTLKQPGVSERMILAPADLRLLLEAESGAGPFSDEEMLSAVGHLAHHGYVATLHTSAGDPRILLAPERLNNIASSIVLKARGNPRGLGSLEESRVVAGEYDFPELNGLRVDEREVLLDSAVAMFLQHNVCFRETDPLTSAVYLVFPELINLRKYPVDEDDVEEGPSYVVSGAMENVYASLVVLLGYTSMFTRASHWRNQARYVVGDGLVC